VCTDLITLEEFWERQMPDCLSLPSNYVHFLLEVEVVFLCELLDGIGGEFTKLAVEVSSKW
jgi:hypothetical protein